VADFAREKETDTGRCFALVVASHELSVAYDVVLTTLTLVFTLDAFVTSLTFLAYDVVFARA